MPEFFESLDLFRPTGAAALSPVSVSPNARLSVRWTAGLLPWCLLLAGPVQGQSLPSASSILKQQEAATPPPVPRSLPVPSIEQERRPAAIVAGGASVRVRSIGFVGADGWANEAELAALVRPALGQTLTAGELLGLADQVSTLLKSRGWLLAQAFLPPQDVTAGDVQIQLLPGSLEGGLAGVVVHGAQRVSAERIRAVVVAPMAGQQGRLNAQQLEEGLLRAAELAGVSATAALERGAQSGTSRLTVDVKEATMTSGSVTLDNFGGPYTGVNRTTGLLGFNSPLGLGDSLMLNLVGSTGLALLTSQLAVPVGDAGIKLGGSLTTLRYQVGADLAALGLQGKALMAGVNATYPLLLSQDHKVRLRVGADHKAYTDTASGEVIGNKVAQVVSAGASGQSQDGLWGGGLNDWSLGLDHGHMDLSRLASVYEADQAGPRANGAFHKWLFSASRLQPLASAWSAQVAVNGQLAGNNLESSEKFSLGGNSGVRAYPGGEGAGDSGVMAKMTVRHEMAWPSSAHRVELSGFVDTGRIRRYQSGDQPVDSATGLNSYNLSGYGLGLGMAQTGRGRVNLIWAHALGSNPGRSVKGNNSDGKAGRSRLLLSLNVDL